MPPEFNGIERRLSKLNERLARLHPLQDKSRSEFARDPYLRDIVERNLEIAAQCCIDISHRIIALEAAPKPIDYHEAILRRGELEVLPVEFAESFASVAEFRNILVHEYLAVDWDQVYENLHHLDDFEYFATAIQQWLAKRSL